MISAVDRQPSRKEIEQVSVTLYWPALVESLL